MQKILVLNSGSSSLKYQLFNVDGDNYEVVAKGLADRIGIEGSLVTIKVGDEDKITKELPLPSHKEAIEEVLDLLLGRVLKSLDELSGVGHRIVHGGEYFDRSVLVDDEVTRLIDELSALAPLHNPAAVMGIRAIKQLLPHVPQVVAFDTAFHQTMKPEAFMYALPLEQYTKYKIRRYGFHGTSHLYVSREAEKMIGHKGKFITCHIGNGASISAIEDGKCVDTSMGFTPLAGVVMGTRSGDMDPFVPLYIMKTQGKTVDEVNTLLNKQSGMLGLCGYSDNRDVEKHYLDGEQTAVDAMSVYVHSMVKYIGSYIAVLGGVEAIVFTGGIGENGALFREQVCSHFEFLGLKINKEINKQAIRGVTAEISTPDSKIKVFVIPTNEELVIAQDVVKLI